MGYYSRVTGHIDIRPALTDHQLGRVEPWLHAADLAATWIIQNGPFTRVTSAGEGKYKHYGIDDTLRFLADFLGAEPSEHSCDGHLVRVGDDPVDIERYRVDPELGVVIEKAGVRWPDGTAYTEGD